MALNVGQDFKKRWLDAPVAVRQAFIDDLSRITELFDAKTKDINAWLEYDKRSLQVAGLKVEQAYTDLKNTLIEEAKVRKQQALETSLAQKRLEQSVYNQQLLKDEALQYQAQTESLQVIRESLDAEIKTYTAQFSKNPTLGVVTLAQSLTMTTTAKPPIEDELENIKIMLELEFEEIIEQTVNTFRAKLKDATQGEIEAILSKITSHMDNK